MDIIEKALKDKTVRHLFITTVIYVFISLIVTSITLNFLSLMLGWNIILAFVPVFLSFAFLRIEEKEKEGIFNKFILLVIFLFWLLFFPNSFYVITDFIHLGGEDFYYQLGLYSPTIYIENFIGYLTLIHIFLGAFIAVYMASYSLKNIHSYFINQFGNIKAWILIIIVLLLSSTGIYIGRFLRLNSWDVLRPFTILRDFFESVNTFVFEYIFIFLLVQISLYLFIKPFLKIEL